MSRFITTKASFTIHKKHKKASGSTVYENDYTTITPLPNAFKGEYVIGDSNFKFSTRIGVNGQKKHARGKFLPNPSGSTEENGAWTIETLINSAITPETKIRLKPNYSSIKDFACYGSANKLVQGTVNGVILDFPAEMYLSNETLAFYGPDEGYAGYSTNEMNSLAETGYVMYNEYNIDIIKNNIQPESVYNPLRHFTLCGSSYTLIDENNEEHAFVGYSAETTALGTCYEGSPVEVDKIAEISIQFDGVSEIKIKVFKDYTGETTYFLYDGSLQKVHIRPKKEIVDQYFLDIDDFTATLLDRKNKPVYTSIFETPKETDTGFSYSMVSYTWPTLNGGFNPDLSGPYFSYLESLITLADFYDEYFTDNMWRSLTHEAIKTLDWTYVSNTDGDVEEMSRIDTSRIEPIAKIYGRQFDDLKRYADGIKTINTITYNQKSNTPDYTLTDALENSGWEIKVLNITNDKDIQTESLYSGLVTGYTASDTNSEFLRRLKLNSNYILASKGTRKGLDSMFSLFGFGPDEYEVHEYVYVASGYGDYTSFCNDTTGKPSAYPLAKDVATINKYKVNFDVNDPYGDYCGIPVAEVGYTINGEDYSYVVPWYSQGKKYDDGLYFQMNGGWGSRETKKISLDIASGITEISGISIYDETQARLKFASNFEDLLQEAAATSSKKDDVFYVTDISDITSEYSFEEDEGVDNLSHYFILENSDYNQFLGYSVSAETYGWRNIKESEITENATTAGTLVLYLESIKDNTTGNNPHIGNGTYDDGRSYIESMENIFGYSLDKQNFIGIDDATCAEISNYVFACKKLEDNRKCWFFTDNYNVVSGRNENEIISFLETEAVTSAICNLSSTITEITDLFDEEGLNPIPAVGSSATEYFQSGYSEDYCRYSNLAPYDPEKAILAVNGEAAANSIINSKEIEIVFKVEESFKEEMTDYINDTVIPYITQVLPSTCILRWSFGTRKAPDKPSKGRIEIYGGE